MAQRINQQYPTSLEEVLRIEIIINKALIDILLAKHIITEEELINRIRNIRHEQMEMHTWTVD